MTSPPPTAVPETLLSAIKSDDVTFLTGCVSHGLPIDFVFPVLPSEPDLLRNHSPLLSAACYYGASDTVRYLLSQGADPTALDDEDRSAVFYAAASGQIGILSLLAGLGVDISGCGQSAVRFGNLDAFRELIERGLISVSDVDFCKSTFLHIAAFEGHADIVRYLLTLGDRAIGACDRDGRTPLHLAAGNGHLVVCELLLGAGADPHFLDSYERSPVYYAAVQERYDIVERLIGGGLNDLGEDGVPPLIRSVKEGKAAMVQLLLEIPGTDPNVRDRNGFTALHTAIRSGRAFIAKLILNCERTDVNAQDAEGQTPLHWAVKKKDMELVQTLLKRQGTNIHLRNASGLTALEELNAKLEQPPKRAE
jgi:ankyrin repeat protein